VAVALVLALAGAPRVLGLGVLVVQGGSMGEAIPRGSVVVTRSLEPHQVAKGDVILLRERTAAGAHPPVLHRVAAIGKRDGNIVITTKGDANRSADPRPYVLDGKTSTPIYHVPMVGFLLGLVSTPIGWLLLILLPAALLCGSVLRSVWVDAPDTDAPRHTVRPDANVAPP
jgi:signal peptidase